MHYTILTSWSVCARKDRRSALIEAALEGRCESAKILIKNGADIAHKDKVMHNE